MMKRWILFMWFFFSLLLTLSSSASVSLVCEKDEIYVNDKNNCTVTGCEMGWWFISNSKKNPLEKEISERIEEVGNRIEFGPVKEEGEILVELQCLNPPINLKSTTRVIKGPYLDCPESCPLREDCTCTVNDCLEGLFLLRNYDGKPLMNNVIEEVTGDFTYTFKAYREGKVEASMLCDKPFRDKSSIIGTYLPEDVKFYMSGVECNETHCSLSIDRNTMEERVKIMVQLLEEPYGVIYSTGSTEVDPGFEGEEIIPLKKLRECREGKELKILVIASVDDRRIDRLKDEYSCGMPTPKCGDGFCDEVAGEDVMNCCLDCGLPPPGCEGNVSYWYTCDDPIPTRHTYDCDDKDGCYAYGDGCEERDYYCFLGACENYTSLNNHTDTCSGIYFLDYGCSDGSCDHISIDCSGNENWDFDSVKCNCDCGGYDTKESKENGNCDDGIDNDCDGFADGEDCDCMPECDESRECESYTCDGRTYVCYYSNSGSFGWAIQPPEHETACDDGHDNDCDGTCDAEGCDGMEGDMDCGVCETCNLRNGGNPNYCQHCDETERWENINEGLICDYYTDESSPPGSVFCLNKTLSSSQVCNLTCSSGSCEGKLPENCRCEKGRCGAECESSIDCTETERCYGKIYQTRTASCTDTCSCSYGPWVNGTCAESVQYCGAECDSDDDCPSGICNPDCTCAGCECTSGPCCDGCHFLPDGSICGKKIRDCGPAFCKDECRQCIIRSTSCLQTCLGGVCLSCEPPECDPDDVLCGDCCRFGMVCEGGRCVTPEITTTTEKTTTTLPAEGGGCPILKVFDGVSFVEIEKLDIHAPEGMDTEYESRFSMEPLDGKYVIILEEAAYFSWDGSHIDHVKLLDEGGKECKLVSAIHSKAGNVLKALAESDDLRVRTSPKEEIKLIFTECSGRNFTLRIEGYNKVIKVDIPGMIRRFFERIFEIFTQG